MAEEINVHEEWQAIERTEMRLIDGMTFTGEEFAGWQLVEAKGTREKDGNRLNISIWGMDEDPENKRLMMQVVESTSTETTPDHLQYLLDHLMSAHLMDEGAKNSVDLGDLCYLHPDKLEENSVLDFLSFASSNVTFRFNSIGEEPISMLEFGTGVQELYEEGTSPGDFENACELEFSAEKTELKVGEPTELSYHRINAPDTLNYFCLIANNSDCRLYRENGKVFFEGMAIGEVEIQLYNLDSETGRSKAAISLTVSE